MRKINLILIITILFFVSGCATQSSKVIHIPKVKASKVPYKGIKAPISIGKFNNNSSYLRGIFSDNIDHLGNQAKTTLVSHLQQTGHFIVLDRTNLTQMKQEASLNNNEINIEGAKYIITGDVTEFGRKEVGDKQLFGILGRGKSQIAYAKVILNVIDIQNSRVVYSTQGSGEFSLSNREVVGFGSTASYDSTLNAKVLDLAIREAVDGIVYGITSNIWSPL